MLNAMNLINLLFTSTIRKFWKFFYMQNQIILIVIKKNRESKKYTNTVVSNFVFSHHIQKTVGHEPFKPCIGNKSSFLNFGLLKSKLALYNQSYIQQTLDLNLLAHLETTLNYILCLDRYLFSIQPLFRICISPKHNYLYNFIF